MTKEQAYEQAQRLVDKYQTDYFVYQHVGDYGNPHGDIKATYDYTVKQADAAVTTPWATVAIVHALVQSVSELSI